MFYGSLSILSLPLSCFGISSCSFSLCTGKTPSYHSFHTVNAVIGYCQGTARLINSIMTKALLLGAQLKKQSIDTDIILSASNELVLRWIFQLLHEPWWYRIVALCLQCAVFTVILCRHEFILLFQAITICRLTSSIPYRFPNRYFLSCFAFLAIPRSEVCIISSSPASPDNVSFAGCIYLLTPSPCGWLSQPQSNMG